MLRQVHFYMKGGKLPFAAVCTEVRIADKVSFRCKCEKQNSAGLASAQGADFGPSLRVQNRYPIHLTADIQFERPQFSPD